MKKILHIRHYLLIGLFFLLLSIGNIVKGASFTAIQNGNWNDPATWGGIGFPGIGDDITISAGVIVSMNVNGNCRSITDMPGGSISGPNSLTIIGVSGVAITDISGTATILCPLVLPALASITVSGTLTISGVISGAAANLTKSGTGKLILSGTNLYDGITTVDAGILNLQNGQGAGSSVNGIVVNNAAQLELESTPMMAISEALSLSGSGATGGSLINKSGTNIWFGSIDIDGVNCSISSALGDLLVFGALNLKANIVTIQGASNVFIPGLLYTSTGTGSIVKDGTGELSFGNQNISIDALTINNGTLKTTSGTLNLAGDFINNGIFDNNNGSLGLTGTTAQNIGGSQQTIFNNLSLNNSSGARLGNSEIIDGTLTLTNGNLILGSNDLTLGAAAVAGNPSVTNMIVADGGGECRRGFTGIGSYVFPIGDKTGTAEYSPVTLNFTSGTFASGSFAGVRVTDGQHPQDNSAADFITRYWSVNLSGISSATYDITGTFVNTGADINGNIANIVTGIWNGSPAAWSNSGIITAPTISASGVTSSADFAGISLIPSPISVSIAANPSLAVCQGASLTLTANAVGNPGFTYLWSPNGEITQAITPPTSSPGPITYSVTVTDANSNSVTKSVTVTVNALPTATISGSTTVCQNQSLPLITFNGTGGTAPYVFTYTFNGGTSTNTSQGNPVTINAVTGTPGIDTYTLLSVSDANTCSQAQSGQAMVTVDPSSVGGSIAGSTTVCSGTNSTLLTLSGYTGTVTKWQYSIDGGTIWADITNTATTYTANNLTITTEFRAVVQSGICPSVNSLSAAVIVDPPSVGGIITGGTTVCSGTNSTLLTLSGQTGAITKWQYSTNGGTTWIDISNTATTFTASNLVITTDFRAVVQDGVCIPDNSLSATVTVIPASVGGSVAGGSIVCIGINSTMLTLSGQTGTVIKWQYSTNGGTTWTDISSTGITYTAINLIVSTDFRAIVQNGTCISAYSVPATVTVIPASIGGAISGGASVCQGTNNTLLTLSGQTGTIIKWQYSTYGGSSWTDISNTGTAYSATNLVVTTDFRAVVQNGACNSAISLPATVTVIPASAGGVVTGGASVCSGANSTLLTLSGQTGTVIKWQYSTNGGSSWTDISNTGITYTTTNLNVTTDFKAVVQNGSCTTANSVSAKVTVVPASAGGLITGGGGVCSGANSTLLTLSGQTGTVTKWQYSTNGGTTWTDISNTGTTYTATNLVVTTYYRAAVQNGVCPVANSATEVVTINPIVTSGTIGTAQTICYNSIPAGLTELSTATGGTGSYTYQWQSSANNSTWTTIPDSTLITLAPGVLASNLYYRRIVTSGSCGSATSTGILITVRPIMITPVASGSRTICYNTVPLALTATSASGGSGTFTYQWQSSPDNTVWANISGANNYSSYTPATLATTTYFRLIAFATGTPACGTVVSNVLTITVLPDLISPVASADQTICYNTAPAILSSTSATGSNGLFNYQWFSSLNNLTWNLITGATGTTYQPSALTTSTYFRIVATATGVPSCGSKNSNAVLITVNSSLTAGTIGTAQTICYNTIPANMTELAPATGGTGTYTYQWQSSPNNITWTTIADSTSPTLAPGALVANMYYRRIVTSGSCGTANSNGILITVRPILTVPFASTSRTICYNTIPSAMSSLPATGGSGTFTYQWQSSPDNSVWSDIAGANNYSSYTPATALIITTYYRLVATATGSPACGTVISNVLTITVLPDLTTPVASADQIICYNTVPLSLSTTTASGGNGTFIYQWYSSTNNSSWNFLSGATGTTYQPPAITSSTYYHIIATATGSPACGYRTSNSVLITVYPNITSGTIGSAQTICYNTIPAGLTELLAATGGTGSYTYQWQSSLNNSTWTTIADSTLPTLTPGALVSNMYYRRIVSSGSCGAATGSSIAITVRPNLTAPVASANQTICFNTIPSALSATTATGGSGIFTYQWQSSPDNSVWTDIAGATNYWFYSPPALTATTYYRLVATAKGTPACGTVISNVLIITVLPDLNSPVVSTDQNICYNTTPLQLTSTAATGANETFSYQWYSSLNNSTWSLINGETGLTYQPPALITSTYYHIIATATGTPACGNKISNAVLIIVNPSPVAIATPAAQTICSGATSSIILTSAVTGTTFSWTVVQSDVSGATAGSGATIAQPLTATGTTVGIATYSITPSANGCAGVIKTVVITVNPTPVAIATPSSQTRCTGVATSVALVSNVLSTSFSWSVVQSGVSGAFSGSGSTISQTLTAIGTTSGTATYSITPTANSCAGIPINVIITVNPSPVAGIAPATQTICSGAATSVALSSNIAGTTFAWTAAQSGVNGAIAASGLTIAQTLNAIGTIAGTVTYTITPSANGCTGLVKTAVITVNPNPAVIGTPSSQTICSGGATSIALSSSVSGTTFAWTYAVSPSGSITGAANGTGNSIAQSLINATLLQANATYSIIPTANSCSGNPLDVIVTVSPVATLSSPLSTSVCSNSIFSYTPASNTPLTAFSWTRAAVLGIQNAASSGTGPISETLINTTGIAKMVIYSYTLSSYGCTTIQSVIVIVFPAPALISSLSPPAVCSNTQFIYNAISSVTGTTMTWMRALVPGISNPAGMGTENINETLINTTVTDVVVPYVYSLTGGGCSGNYTVNATIKPTPNVSVPANMDYCNGDNVPAIVFTGTVTGTTYTWGNNNTTIGLSANGTGNIPSFTAINAASAPITAIVSVRPSANGCNGSNSTFTITVDPVSQGGTVNSDAIVCSGTNSGTLSLSGQTGTVTKWQSSTNGGTNWIDINNTTTSQAYTNLIITTQYRAVVQSGVCASANSSIVTITVNQPTVGGTVSADATVCYGTNTGTLTLIGQTGTITKWQYSVNGGTSWSDISNTSTTQNCTNLVNTTQYRAVLQNGVCAVVNSAFATITVNPISVAGSVSGGSTICSGSTSGLLTLSGQVGTVTKWQYSLSPFSSWSDIANTGTSYTSVSLTQTTQFRAVVTSGICSSANSTPTTVNVDPPSVGGAVSGGTTICSGTTSGLLTLSGHTGTISKWQYSVSPFSIWTDIANTTTSFTSGVLAQTIQFRAVITSGICSSANSSPTTVTVDPLSAGGSVSGGTTICSGSTSGLLTLSGQTGAITKWQYSVSPFLSWTDIANTAITYTSGSLTQTTQFRAVVTSGICSPAISALTAVIVDPTSVGGTVSGGTTICSGSTSGLLTLSGQTGTITKWQYSVSPFSTWIDIANTASTYTSVALTQTTEFRAVVTSGVCSQANSASTTVTVSPTSVGGSVAGGATICSGSSSGLLTLSGQVGTVTKWQYSVSPFSSWTDIVNTATSYTSGVLTQSTQFRAVVQNGTCPASYSATATITVNPIPTLSSTLTPTGVCSNVAFTYMPTSTTLGTTFNWTRAVVAGISNPANSGTGNPDEYLLNTTNSPIAVTYVYTLSSNGCSNIQNVVVIVTPTPHLTSTSSPTPICGGTTFSYVPTSDVVGTIFPWTRAAALGNPVASGTGNPNEILINNTSTTASVTYLYTLQSNDCVNPVTYPVSVAIVPAPVVTINSSSTTICSGASINLTSSSNISSSGSPTLLSENFNSVAAGTTTGPNGWTTTNTSSGGTVANATWTVRQNNYANTWVTFSSNDASNFYLSDSRSQAGASTLTTLVSPQINTTNYTSLTLDFYDYFNDRGAGNGDYAYIDISTNNGTSWTALSVPDYNENTSHGTSNGFVHQSINLSAYIGNTNFKFRYRYVATNDRYWAIDNITLSGTPSATATIAWTSIPVGFTSNIATPTNVTPSTTTTYIATYTDPVTNCPGSNSVVVTVNPVPAMTSSNTASVCSGGTVNIPLIASVPSTFAWVAVSNANVTGESTTSQSTSTLSNTLTNATSSVQTVVYTVTPTGTAGSCVGYPQTVTVTVNPIPSVTQPANQTFCSAASTTAIAFAGSGVTGTAYNWTNDNPGIGLAASGTGTIASFTAVNSGTTPIIANIVVTPVANGCSGTAKTFTITVNPTPTPTIVSDYCTYRSIGKVRLTSSTCASCTYSWNTGATLNYIDVDLAGNYTVTVTNASGCSASSSIAVAQELVVNGNFSAGNSGFTSDYAYKVDQPGLVPAGQGELYDDSGINGYSIVNNGQNVHTYFFGIDHTQNVTGNKNFMIVNGHGTLVVWKETVTVQPNTDYYFAAWAMSVNDAGNYAQLRFAVNGVQVGTTATLGAGPNTVALANTNTYWTRFYSNPKWNSGALSGPVVLSIVDLNTSLPGNDFGIDDISFGTLASVPFSISASSNSPAASPICSRGTLNLTSTITGGSPPIVYSWTGPNGFTSSLANPVVSNIAHDAGGVYTVSVLDAYNCPGTTASTTVVLNPTPEVPNQLLDVCSGTLFNATPINGVPNASTFVPPAPEITAYTWAAPVVTGGLTGGASGTGLLSITGTLTNPTTNIQTATYTITPFTYTGTPATPKCTGTPFTLVVTVYPTAIVSAGANRTVCADAPGVTLAGTKGGGASSASWTGGTTAGFNPDRNSLTAIYTPTAAEITAGSVILTLTTNDPAGPCGAVSASMTITIDALPVLSAVATNVNCFGGNTGAVNLTVTGTATPYTYAWTASAGGVVPGGQSALQNLTNLVAGTYTVVVTGHTPNTCIATTSITITQPAAALSVTGVVTGMLCAGGATGTITLTVTGGTTNYSYLWTASSGGVVPVGQATNKDLTGLASGDYSVTVTDAKGCTASLTKTVTVAVNTAPVITTCPLTRNINGCSTSVVTGPVFSATTAVSSYAVFSDAVNNKGVATDNCAITTVSYRDVTIIACPITVTRTWTLGDAGSLTSTCQQTITITDNTPPVWTTVAGALNRTVSCSDAASLATAQALAPVATDNCVTVSLTKTSGAFVAGACSGSGSYTNTWIAVDNCSNTSSVYTQLITIIDNTAPVWTSVAGSLNRTVECSNVAAITAAQALFPVASDNCDASLGSIVKVSGAFVTGACSHAGTYTNTWTVSDHCGNSSSVFTQVITITDQLAPVWLTAPGDLNQTLECSDASGLLAAQAFYPVASDNCTANVTILNKTSGSFVRSGACIQEGTYTNTWTVSDGCGNTSVAYTQVITIEDNAGPVIHCPGDDAFSCDSPSFGPSLTGTAIVIDNCDAAPSVTWSDVIVPGACAGNYQINRTWKTTDACGKFNTCKQAISVQDVTPPVITCAVTGNLNVYPNPALPYVVPNNSWDATAIDNCSGATLTATLSGATVSGPHNTLSGLSFNEGVTTVTWTAIDGCGISSHCQFTITVSFRPVINCPANIISNNDVDVCNATLNPGLPSLVVGTAPIVYSWAMTGATIGSGIGPIGYYTFNKGVTTITWTGTNVAGAGVCAQTITVFDNQPPVFSIPTEKEYCVLDIYQAEFDAPTTDISPARPDYFLFKAGNTDLDLNPATFDDNCSSSCTYEIRWRLDFQDGTFLPALPDMYITGQPSGYGVDIPLPGNAITNVLHHITYYLVDCSGNVAAPKTAGIIIKPRPDVIKTTVH